MLPMIDLTPPMSIEDVARHFQVSIPTVRARLIPAGLPHYRVGNRWRFRRADVEAFEQELVARQTIQPPSTVIQFPVQRSGGGVD